MVKFISVLLLVLIPLLWGVLMIPVLEFVNKIRGKK